MGKKGGEKNSNKGEQLFSRSASPHSFFAPALFRERPGKRLNKFFAFPPLLFSCYLHPANTSTYIH